MRFNLAKYLKKIGIEIRECENAPDLRKCPYSDPECHFYDSGSCNTSKKHLLEKFDEIDENKTAIYIVE